MSNYSFDSTGSSSVSITESTSDHFGVRDDEYSAPEPVSATYSGTASLYEQLRKDLQKPADLPEDKVIPVPGRKGYGVRYSADLDLTALTKWRKLSQEGRHGDVNGVEFACRILVGQCIGLVRNGTDVKDGEGRPLDFRHPDLAELLGIPGNPLAAVESLYGGRDVNIIKVSEEVLALCGYGDNDEDDLDEDDPKD